MSAKYMPTHGWTCFHCGENFTTVGSARDHFGGDILKEPGCLIRVQLGDERGLLMALRKAETELSNIRRELSDEDTAKDRIMSRMQHEHAVALRREEEKGYARGLADARKFGLEPIT